MVFGSGNEYIVELNVMVGKIKEWLGDEEYVYD